MALHTERLVIDALVRADIPALMAYRNDPEVARDQAWPLPFGHEAGAHVVAWSVGSPFEGGQMAIRRHDGPLIGDLMARPVADTTHAFDLGITLARPAWGQGLATEALTAVIDELFAHGRVHKLAAFVFASNDASQRLFDRLGFRREGHLTDSYARRDGALTDEILFGYPRALWHRAGTELTTAPHPADLDCIGDRLYEFNRDAVGCDDGARFAVLRRGPRGRIEAGLTGWTWAGVGYVEALWVQAELRGHGIGRRLLVDAEAEIARRGCRFVFLASHTFQAPGLYDRAGYERLYARVDLPLGHGDVLFRKRIDPGSAARS